MTDKEVRFLERDFTISTQLPVFVEILDQFDGYSNELYSIVVKQAKSGDYTGNADTDFVKWRNPIESIAKRVIQSAARYGVYDLTVAELVDCNPGVKQLNKVCENTFEETKNSLIASLENFKSEMYNAGQRAASNIKGSGISIWTNSLSSLLIYSAFEMSTIKKQCNKADREFRSAIAELDRRTTNQQEREQVRVLTQLYYPGCNSAIPVIISYMLEEYLKRIDQTGQFNYKDICKYDLAASSEILKNIDLIPEKGEEVIVKAFEKCPYNPDIYKKLIDIDRVDYDTFEIAKYLHQNIILNPFIKEYVEDRVEQKLDATEAIRIWASYMEMDEKEAYKLAYSDVCNTAMNSYKSIVDAINDNGTCVNWISNNISQNFSLLINNKEHIPAIISNVVLGILDIDTYNTLCKVGLLETKKFNLTGSSSSDYNLIMDDLSKKLTAKVIDVIDTEEKKQIEIVQKESINLSNENEERIGEHNHVGNSFQNYEGTSQKREGKKNQSVLKIKSGASTKKSRVICVALAIFLIILISTILLIGIIIPSNKYNVAVKLENEGRYEEAIEAFEALGEYKDAHQHIETCKRKQSETETRELVQNTNSSLMPYLSVIGNSISKNSVDVTQEFMDGRENVFVMGRIGTVVHGVVNADDETITLMDWISNDEIDDKEFNIFLKKLNEYFGENATKKYYENFKDSDSDVWVWSSKNGLWPICFLKENRVYIRWYDIKVVE